MSAKCSGVRKDWHKNCTSMLSRFSCVRVARSLWLFTMLLGQSFLRVRWQIWWKAEAGIDMVAMARARSSGWVIMRGSGQPGRMDMIRSAIGITRRWYHLSRATTTTANKHHEWVRPFYNNLRRPSPHSPWLKLESSSVRISFLRSSAVFWHLTSSWWCSHAFS